MSKIIFSDLDGTLLTDDAKKISPRDMAAIKAATSAGFSFVIATGRPHASALKVAKELGLNFPGAYIISFNGGCIYECGSGNFIYKKTLGIDVVRRLFERANEENFYIQTYKNDRIVARKYTEELKWYHVRTNLGTRTGEDVFEYLGDDEPNKCIIIDIRDRQRLENFRIRLEKEFAGEVQFVMSCDQYLEVMPVGVSKGSAVIKMADILGVDIKDTIAVGDEENDIEMIKAAGVGIAMKNARENVKAVADYVTSRNNNESAMEEIIEKYKDFYFPS